MSRVFAITIVAAGVALAVVVGQRMSSDAMAVVIGVVFGVAASIPTSLLVVAATRRAAAPPARPALHDPPPAPPPQIYIVQPGQTGGQAPWLEQPTSQSLPFPPAGYPAIQSPRRFKVVGEDEHWLDALPEE